MKVLKISLAVLQVVLPSGEADDVPRLDQAAQLIPHGDGDTSAFIGDFTRPHFVSVLCLGHATWKRKERKKKKELVTVPTRCLPLTEHTRQHTDGVFSEAVRSNAGANHDLTVMLTVAEVSVAHQIRKRVVSTVLSGQDSSALLTYFQNYKDDMQVFRSWFYVFNQAHGVVVNIRHRLKKKKAAGDGSEDEKEASGASTEANYNTVY